MDTLRGKAPNLAVVLFLCVPLIAAVLAALRAAGGNLQAGTLWFSGFYAIGCCAAAAPLASRVKEGPIIALGITTLLYVVGDIGGRIAAHAVEVRLYDDESLIIHNQLRGAAKSVLIFAAAGLGCAFLRMDAYTEALDRDTFPGLVRAGFRRLVRDDATAPWRALGGVALAIATIALLFTPLARQESGAPAVPRGLLLGSFGLLASSIVLRDEPEVDDIPPPRAGGIPRSSSSSRSGARPLDPRTPGNRR